jgi:hypothetical protein
MLAWVVGPAAVVASLTLGLVADVCELVVEIAEQTARLESEVRGSA